MSKCFLGLTSGPSARRGIQVDSAEGALAKAGCFLVVGEVLHHFALSQAMGFLN